MSEDAKRPIEREFETGTDEAFKGQNVTGGAVHNENERVIFSNIKRTYDEYQHESLESIRRNRSIVDKLVSDAQQFDNARQAVANQALQNAVETANMVAKQAVRHGDIAIDAQWNPIQQGTSDKITGSTVMDSQVAAKAVDAAIAKSVDATITPVLAVLQQMVQSLAASTASIANVLSQAQPKKTA